MSIAYDILAQQGDEHLLDDAPETHDETPYEFKFIFAETLGKIKEAEKAEREARAVEGRKKGRKEGMHHAIISILNARFNAALNKSLSMLTQIEDPETLEILTKKAATVPSFEDFLKILKTF